ncbi:MAG TPA: ATP-binding protein [Polyangiaceae bacterium]|nr:ATP-binding protein [Polyangiaceae bacterium]
MGADPQIERLRAELARLVSAASAAGGGAEQFVALFGLFLANVPDFIVMFAMDGTILFLNRARPGKTIAEVVGTNVFDYLGTESDRIRAVIDRVAATGDTVSLESHARYTDGTKHDFLTRISPVVEGGRILALVSIATEITAQKQAEAALRDSEEKLRLAVAATSMGLWSWDAKKDEIAWDDAMCRIWGVTQDTAPRTREAYLRTIHPEDQALQRDAISRAVKSGDFPDRQYRVVRPDGTVRRTLSKASVTRAADGSIEKLVGGVLDITEQREFEDRVRQTQKLEAIGQLSAGVAHNFNNMLTVILPNIELAMADASPESASMLRSAREAALRAAELVRQLVAFAGRSRQTERRAEDVRLVVERAVTMCRRAFDQSIEVSVLCPPEEQPVLSDAAQLEQALVNLLINARDAVLESDVAPKKIAIEVERVQAPATELPEGLDAERKYVAIRVVDNGVGMSAATSARLYEPFFTTKDVGKGTGLGLSTARATVREHGGVIDCRTVPGAGTTFALFLPLVAPVAPVEQATVGRDAPRSGSHRILVIDDELPVREVTRRMLEREGYVVHVAASGREALALLADDALLRSIDLVLLDRSMPVQSGEAVRAELAKLAPRLKVAYFSGHADGVPGDVVGVVEKPVTYDGLMARVRELLERPES